MEEPLIEPKTEPQDPEVAPNTPQQTGLPPELSQLPAMHALLAGSPPALSASIKEFSQRPEAKMLATHKDLLQRAGMGFYRSLSGDLGVIFNQFFVHPQDIQSADSQGKLLSIAPPFDAVDQAVAKSGAGNPVLNQTERPAGFAQPRNSAPPQSASGPADAPDASAAPVTPPAYVAPQGQPAGAQREALKARMLNMQAGAPTSGQAGAGRLLNQVLKPVI